VAELQGTHFWWIVVQTPRRFRRPVITASTGTITAMPGDSRYDLFWKVRDQVDADYPQARGGRVIAFELQRNEP
jgi:hypothetical protein